MITFDKVLNLSVETKELQRRLDISFDKISEFSRQRNTGILQATVAQVIPDATITFVLFDLIRQDKTELYNSTTNRVTIKVSGTYLIVFTTQFASGGGQRNATIQVNGSDIAQDSNDAVGGGFRTPMNVSIVLPLLANDYIRVYVYQNTGSGLSLATSSGLPTLSVVRLGD